MTVIIPKQAYLTIIAASIRFANQKIPKDKWIEANGIFIGKNQNDDVKCLNQNQVCMKLQEKRCAD